MDDWALKHRWYKATEWHEGCLNTCCWKKYFSLMFEQRLKCGDICWPESRKRVTWTKQTEHLGKWQFCARCFHAGCTPAVDTCPEHRIIFLITHQCGFISSSLEEDVILVENADVHRGIQKVPAFPLSYVLHIKHIRQLKVIIFSKANDLIKYHLN